MYKILPSITTTQGSNWREQTKEVENLKLKEIGLFVTYLEKPARQELYQALEKLSVKIPFVHLRADCDLAEVEYLMRVFKTQKFNIHAKQAHPLEYDLSKHKDKIYLENQDFPLSEEELKAWAGICLDISHLEENLRNGLYYNINLLRKYPIGCVHISAVPVQSKGDAHKYVKLQDFDYLKKHKNYRAPLMALELENTIAEQLEAKKYIEGLWRF